MRIDTFILSTLLLIYSHIIQTVLFQGTLSALTWDRCNRCHRFRSRRHRTFGGQVTTPDRMAMRPSWAAWPVPAPSPCRHTGTACCLGRNSNLLKINIVYDKPTLRNNNVYKNQISRAHDPPTPFNRTDNTDNRR